MISLLGEWLTDVLLRFSGVLVAFLLIFRIDGSLFGGAFGNNKY